MSINVCVFEKNILVQEVIFNLLLPETFMWRETESAADAERNLSFVILFPVKTGDRCGRAEGQLIWI